MERLTKTYSDGTHGAADNLPCGENSYEYKGLLLEALGKYEDAEEQGLILRLPCKVGDKVWHINKPFILEYEVTGFSVDETGAWLMQIEHYASETDRTYGYNLETDSLGTTWFLSKEESEAKLKETEDANVHECD